MPKAMKLDAVKLGLAAGIITGICVGLTIIASLVGIFEGYTSLVIEWLDAIYGFVGYSTSVLGVFLGAIYAAIDTFIFVWLVALLYNKLIK